MEFEGVVILLTVSAYEAIAMAFLNSVAPQKCFAAMMSLNRSPETCQISVQFVSFTIKDA